MYWWKFKDSMQQNLLLDFFYWWIFFCLFFGGCLWFARIVVFRSFWFVLCYLWFVSFFFF